MFVKKIVSLQFSKHR